MGAPISFAGIMITGILGRKLLFLVFTALFVLSFLIPFFLTIGPNPICSRCDHRMKRRWIAKSQGSGDDLFFVCEQCKTYADGHLSRD